MQRHPSVGRVQGLPAPAGLAIDRPVGSHEARDIRDRVVHDVAAPAPFEVQGLVEVHRPGGIDGDERELAPVGLRRRRRGHRGIRLGEHVGGEAVGQVQFGAEVGERGGELALRGRRGDVGAAAGHAPSLGGARN